MGLTSATGLISGINFNDAVSQLAELEARPITLLQIQKARLESVSAELSSLSLQLSGLKSAASNLASLSSFNTNTVSVTKTTSGVELFTATVDSTAVNGTTQVTVNQIAQTHSIASQGFVDKDTTGVASADGTFTFKLGTAGAATSIAVTTSTTLEQLRDAINTANGSVSASIINDGSGSNSFRLILNAKEPGASNTISITSNPTTLDFTNKQIEAAFAKETNSYSGTVSSNDGANYTGTTNKAFLVEIVTAGTPESGTAQYKYSIDGGITFLGANGAAYQAGVNEITAQTSSTAIDGSGTTNEGVEISFGSGTGTLAVGDQFSIDVFNPTLQEGKNAVIEVGNLTISKSTNTITDVIQGVTLNLTQADAASTIDVTISTNSSDVKSLIEDFLASYNSVISFLHDQLSFDAQFDSSGKPLLGDTTTVLINRQLQDLITSIVPGASSGLNSLAQLGVETDTDTSEISLNNTKFEAALASSLTDVTRLFVGIGVPSNSQIEFVSKTDSTQSGSYGLVINTAPTKATVVGGGIVPSAGITDSETISVNFFSNATATSSTPETVQITASSGSTINDIVNSLNSAFATGGLAVSASNNGGQIQIRANEYGDDFKIQVLSTAISTSNQSGFTNTVSVGTGADITGTINGFKATGVGAVLTSASGFAEDGLSIRAEVVTSGNYGTVTVSSGITDRMSILLERSVNVTNGTLKARQDGIETSVEDLDKQIVRKQIAVAAFEERTRAQFQRLEVLLSQFQIQGQALSAGITSIQNLQTQINNR